MIEIIIGIGCVVIITLLAVLNVHLRIKTGSLSSKISSLENTNNVLLAEVEKLKDEVETSKLEKSDGFVKFLSESREWAFSFIDDVQSSILKLKEAMDRQDSKQSLEEFQTLLKFLPKEELNKEK